MKLKSSIANLELKKSLLKNLVKKPQSWKTKTPKET